MLLVCFVAVILCEINSGMFVSLNTEIQVELESYEEVTFNISNNDVGNDFSLVVWSEKDSKICCTSPSINNIHENNVLCDSGPLSWNFLPLTEGKYSFSLYQPEEIIKTQLVNILIHQTGIGFYILYFKLFYVIFFFFLISNIYFRMF